jgi:hypothetical protein
MTRKRPLDVAAAGLELLTVSAAAPLALPLLGVGAVFRTLHRLAPPLPEVDMPPKGEANLLAHLLAQAVPAYLANAAVRLALLRLPFPVAIAIRAGRTSATLRVGRGRVGVENGVASDAIALVEGEVEPLLRLAAGSVLRQLGTVRVRPA